MSSKYVYIVLTMTDTIVARTIRFLTGKPYCHSSLALDEDLSDMYSFCRDKKEYPLPASFNKENINTQVFGLYNNIPCEIYRLELTDEQHERLTATMRHFIVNKDLYRYNLTGLLLMKCHIPHKLRYKFVCSVWVAFVLGKSGIEHNLKKHLSLIEPEDLRYIKNAELFYRGNLKDYPEFLKNMKNSHNSLVKNPLSIKKSVLI
jgi:hypothetical protein